MMVNRGTEVSAWNWKLKEIEDGKIQPDEDTLAKNPINLQLEIKRVEIELELTKKEEKKRAID